MSDFTQAKNELAELMRSAGYEVKPYLPESFTPPIAVIENQDPYITSGTTFGDYRMNVTLSCVFPRSPNKETTEAADDLLAEVLELVSETWGFEEARTVYVDDNGNTYAATTINLFTDL